MKNPRRFFWILFFAGLVFRLFYIGMEFIDLAPDEAYYWQWSRNLDWCYYSKGPMVAFLIWLGTHLLGYTPLGVRFLTIVLSGAILYFSLKLYERLFPGKEQGIWLLALFFHTIPLFLVGGLLMTIDPPLCTAWIVCLWALHAAVKENKAWYWIILSITLGLGILAKYTMLLFILTIFFYLGFSKENRPWLKRPAPYLALAGSFVFFLFPLIWNANHNWVSFWHTAELGGFGKETHWLKNLIYFPEMILTQMGIVSPIIFVLLAIALFHHAKQALTKEQNDSSLLLLCAVVPVFLLYTLLSLKRAIIPNWLVAVYPAAVIAGSQFWSEKLADRTNKRWFISGIGLGTMMCLVLLSANVFYYLNLPNPGKLDPALRLRGWKAFAQTAEQTAKKLPKDKNFFYFGIDYQAASELAFYIPSHPKTYCASSRPLTNQYDIWGGSSKLWGENAILAMRFRKKEDIALPTHVINAFGQITADQTVPVYQAGHIIRWDQTWLCYDFKGWTIKTELELLQKKAD